MTGSELRKPMNEIIALGMSYRDVQIKEWVCAKDLTTANSRNYSRDGLPDFDLEALASKNRRRLDKLRHKVGHLQLSLVSLTLDLREHPTFFIKHDDKEYCEKVQGEVKRLKQALLECQGRVGGLQFSFEQVFQQEDGFHWKASRIQDWTELFVNPYQAEAWEAPRDDDE